MSALGAILRRRISAGGPMTLADYMAECLLHPDHGYYATRDPFGSAGDFTTAPEISQMFGELIGLSLAQYWMDMGAPACALVELGPGRGTLMADILRATRRVPEFHASVSVYLMEASAVLRAQQRQTLSAYKVHWIDSISDLPDLPLLAVANEFFDALPIRQFTRVGNGWAETVVGLVDDALKLGQTAPAPIGLLAHRLGDTREGDVVEICPAAAPIAGEIGQRIGGKGGCALFIDYGGWTSFGDTFQAMQDHRFVDPLHSPGEADLTAHVDFRYLADNALPAAHAFATQGAFLGALGIDLRSSTLAAKLDGPALEAHLLAHRRLTDPAEMGSLFKVLALHRAGMPPPPGMH